MKHRPDREVYRGSVIGASVHTRSTIIVGVKCTGLQLPWRIWDLRTISLQSNVSVHTSVHALHRTQHIAL